MISQVRNSANAVNIPQVKFLTSMLSCVGYPRCYLLSSDPAYISFTSVFFLLLSYPILRVLSSLYIPYRVRLDMNEDTVDRESSIILASRYSLTLSPYESRKVVCTDAISNVRNIIYATRRYTFKYYIEHSCNQYSI